MKPYSLMKYILLGAMVGLGAAALVLFLYCVVWALPYAGSGDVMSQDERDDMLSGIGRFGLAMFVYRAGPIGLVSGVALGIIVFFMRKRRRLTVVPVK